MFIRYLAGILWVRTKKKTDIANGEWVHNLAEDEKFIVYLIVNSTPRLRNKDLSSNLINDSLPHGCFFLLGRHNGSIFLKNPFFAWTHGTFTKFHKQKLKIKKTKKEEISKKKANPLANGITKENPIFPRIIAF